MVVRTVAPGRALALGLALLGGCYSTTPHRAEVVSRAQPQDCGAIVADVLGRSGLVQLPTPTWLSMFFGPGMHAEKPLVPMGVGVGVTIDAANGGPGGCHVTLEALSPDPSCAGSDPSGLGSNICELSYAPGHDASVDELAQRVRVSLGPQAKVD
jgi:hypothetical protein